MRLKMPSAESFDNTDSEPSETLLACCHINLDEKARFGSSWLAVSTVALYSGKGRPPTTRWYTETHQSAYLPRMNHIDSV